MAKRTTQKKNPNLHLLWPTPFLVKKFGQYQKVNKELLELFYKHRSENESKKSSMYASKDNIYALYGEQECVKKLVKFIMDGVFEVASEVNAPYWGEPKSIDIEITGLWFQMSNDHCFHETHVHGNCAWSGVYYVQAGDCDTSKKSHKPGEIPNGVTRFYGPHLDISAGGHGEFGNMYLQDTHFDSYPESGKLVVFPPHIKHMPFPYNGEEDRVIVSFHAQIHNPDGFSFGYSFS